jgi:hypothetical protein
MAGGTVIRTLQAAHVCITMQKMLVALFKNFEFEYGTSVGGAFLI